ncbi:MAG: hypothetical protein FJZ58_00775 [Chlamydiae bacterium]|nr:hypothetical protein [Chlamydiota bacterium]
MKWWVAAFLFCTSPLTCKLHHAQCDDLYRQAVAAWEQHNQRLTEYQKSSTTDPGSLLPLLQDSLSLCRRAKDLLDQILEDIRLQSKEKRRYGWRAELRTKCRREQEIIFQEIHAIEGICAFHHVTILCKQAEDIVQEAAQNFETCHLEKGRILGTSECLHRSVVLSDQAAILMDKACASLAPFASQHQNHEIAFKNLLTYRALTAHYQYQAEGVRALYKATQAYELSQRYAAHGSEKAEGSFLRLDNLQERISALESAALDYQNAIQQVREALAYIAPYDFLQKDQDVIQHTMEHYQAIYDKYRNDIALLPHEIAKQKTTLYQQCHSLLKEARSLQERGLKQSSHALYRQAASLLEKLVASSSGTAQQANFAQELREVSKLLSSCQQQINTNALPIPPPSRSKEEQHRKEQFFTHHFLSPTQFLSKTFFQASFPRALPLDGQKQQGDTFQLFTEQFSRFLIQSDQPISSLCLTVYQQEKLIHKEKISLPPRGSLGWDRYLQEGLIFFPETHAKELLGMDLRIQFVRDPSMLCSLLIAHKSSTPGYTIALSLGEDSPPLYTGLFSLPLPWQLCTPLGSSSLRSRASSIIPYDGFSIPTTPLEQEESYPLLDQLILELQKDPMALAAYVHHEIALVDVFLYEESGKLHPHGIQKNPQTTFLEQEGSPLELCELLVYLLRKAGYQAFYALSDTCTLNKDYAERLLFTEFPKEEVHVHYPWVVFLDKGEWISLFPWMKEMDIHEGYDLYSRMPEAYASADRFLRRYLQGDEQIIKHIGPGGDDTVGILFMRFVQETLKDQNLTLHDVGVHRVQRKKQYSSWEEFPRPKVSSSVELFSSLKSLPIQAFGFARISLLSKKNQSVFFQYKMPLPFLGKTPAFFYFNNDKLHFHINNQHLEFPLSPEDHLFEERFSTVQMDPGAPSPRAFCKGGNMSMGVFFLFFIKRTN